MSMIFEQLLATLCLLAGLTGAHLHYHHHHHHHSADDGHHDDHHDHRRLEGIRLGSGHHHHHHAHTHSNNDINHHHHHHDHRSLEEQGISKCSTPQGQESDILQQTVALGQYQQAIQSGRIEDSSQLITIPVCFHVIQDDNGTVEYSDELFQDQMDALNRAYGADSCCDESLEWCDSESCSFETSIRFAWAVLDENDDLVEGATVNHLNDTGACFRRINNSKYSKVSLDDEFDNAMKQELRKGDARHLNVYWTTLENYLGYATFPWFYDRNPVKDGIVLRAGSAPGGGLERYDEGDTLVHEIGHWLGLFHTFQGGCSASDGVKDTAPESLPFYGCGNAQQTPLDRDSCPGDTFSDPVFNFMDYSDDACLYHFTEGQATVMKACYNAFRLGYLFESDTIALTLGIPSEPIFLPAMQQQIYTIEAEQNVVCSVSIPEGQVSIFMRWNRNPSFNFLDSKICLGGLFGSAETCEAKYPSGFLSNIWPFSLFQPKGVKTLHVGIRPVDGWSLQDVSITCT